MQRLRFLLPIGLAVTTSLVACKKKETKPADPPKTTEPTPPPTTGSDGSGSAGGMAGGSAGSGSDGSAATPADANTTDSDLAAHVMMNLDEVKEWKPVPSLPAGATMTVLEGAPPFGPGKGFAFLLKFPKNYKIPPHTHLVSERVTVLSGSLQFGHGEKWDPKALKEVKQGGIVIVPAGHAHFVNTKTDVVVQLQGVGPWGIHYIDPKDDPRKPVPEKPADVAHDTDFEQDAVQMNLADIKWNPAPPSLPAGAQIAVIEGKPPFPGGKSFVFRLKMPDGYKIPVHHHMVTERVVVTSGTLKFGTGDKWDDKALKDVKAGGIAYMPREHKHFVQAKGETTVQLQGVGPWGIVYANPDEDPRNAKK
ncbi:MAG TPA: cupin domain-containing protein [Kofleriaceae bacterium]